eukprot:1161654-Pelagomonas_calceolata.AAC.10
MLKWGRAGRQGFRASGCHVLLIQLVKRMLKAAGKRGCEGTSSLQLTEYLLSSLSSRHSRSRVPSEECKGLCEY